MRSGERIRGKWRKIDKPRGTETGTEKEREKKEKLINNWNENKDERRDEKGKEKEREKEKKGTEIDIKKNPRWFSLMLHQMEMVSTIIEPLSSRTIGEIIQAPLSD